jgi:hypothetical protein
MHKFIEQSIETELQSWFMETTENLTLRDLPRVGRPRSSPFELVPVGSYGMGPRGVSGVSAGPDAHDHARSPDEEGTLIVDIVDAKEKQLSGAAPRPAS